MSKLVPSPVPDVDPGVSSSPDSELEAWLLFLDSAGSLCDLLDDLSRLCASSGPGQDPLREVCVPLDFPLLAEREPQLAEQLVYNFPGFVDNIRRLLHSAACGLDLLPMDSSPGPRPLQAQQLAVQARIFQFPRLGGISSCGQLAHRLGRLSSLECQIVSMSEPMQCTRALRYLCSDPHCPSVLCQRPLIVQRVSGHGLAALTPAGADPGPIRCPDCAGPLTKDASGCVQVEALQVLALPTADPSPGHRGVKRAIPCVAIGNRLTRQLWLGRRCRLLGLPLRLRAQPRLTFELEIVDAEPLTGPPLPGPVARRLGVPSNLSGGCYGAALYAAFYLGSAQSTPGSWMTVKLTVLLLLLAGDGCDEEGWAAGDEEEGRLRPLSLCLMSPGDFASVLRWLQAVCDGMGPWGVTHRCGVPVAAAVRQRSAGEQALDAGTLCLAEPGGVALFPYLSAGMRTPDLCALAWSMETGRVTAAAGPSPAQPPLACSVIGLIERGACGNRLAPQADGCYGNETNAADCGPDDESLGYKRDLAPMRRELRHLLSRFQLYLECEEPETETAAAHYLAGACRTVVGCEPGQVMELILAQRHLPCEFSEAASAALQRHFMAGRRVFEAKRLSFGRDSMSAITGLAVGHARLNCRSQVLTEDVVLAAYLLEVSTYCLHGSSHFAISYLGHLAKLDREVVAEFGANLAEFHRAVGEFMSRDPRATEE